MTTAVANAGALPSARSGAFVLGRTFLHPLLAAAFTSRAW